VKALPACVGTANWRKVKSSIVNESIRDTSIKVKVMGLSWDAHSGAVLCRTNRNIT
jgi:hypothetical protein